MTRTSLQATSAYYDANPATRLLRFGLATSQRLWPALAVRAAQRLFGTPLPLKWAHRRKAFSADWRSMRWPFEDSSLSLYQHAAASGPAGAPVALLVHGWGGHAGQMLALADALAARGLQPMMLEMPAHGRNAGSASNLPQFARAIDYVTARLQQQGYRLHAVAAHSLAASAAAYAASRGLPVERLVLLAPPASPHGYTRLFAQVFGLSEATRAAMQRRIESREGILMQQFEPAFVGPRIRLPVLVVHDRHDSINRFADGESFSTSIAGAQLFATEGLGHRRILRDTAVLDAVAAFTAPAG